MTLLIPEKKLKRITGTKDLPDKPEKTIFPFLIFLAILFIVAYVFFANVCF